MAKTLTILPRSRWGAKPATGKMTPQDPHAIRELFIHHVGNAAMRHHTTTDKAERAAILGFQAYHQHTHGWFDLGYSFVLCPPWGRDGHAGNIYAGRGLDVVPAGQLNHNQATIALLILSGGDDPVDEHLVERMRAFTRWAEHEVGHNLTVRPHSAVTSTECPGPALRAAIKHLQDV